MYEVWHYDETSQYNPQTKSGGLFSEYIDLFLRLKQQADGYPSWAITDQQKARYIEQYLAHEGIQLVAEEIKPNPGLRSLAKLCLNSFWGKFGQRNNMNQLQYFNEPEKFFNQIFNNQCTVQSITLYEDQWATVRYQVDDQYLAPLGNTNPIIASFVTAQARLKLYSFLEILQERVLYFDTGILKNVIFYKNMFLFFHNHLDSVIYLSKVGDEEIALGNFLGEMTNELACYGDGAYIDEFVSGGPKNYAFKVTIDGDQIVKNVVKIRGVSLNYLAKEIVNFDEIKDMVFKYAKGDRVVKVVNETKILRNNNRCIYTGRRDKDYRIVYDKRILIDNYCTIPYGY